MNITDYIVDAIKQGRTVELPGIGTFSTQTVAAHFDDATATFYPTRQQVDFSLVCKGDSSIVDYLAERDCVGRTTAEQMFKNYMDALQRKLKEGNEHAMPGLGALKLGDAGFSFALEDGATVSTSASTMSPVSGIRMYEPKQNERNPFDVFDNPVYEEPEPVVDEPAVEPEPVVEPEPEPVPEEVEEPEVEVEPEVEPEPEEEVIEEQEPVEIEKPKPEIEEPATIVEPVHAAEPEPEPVCEEPEQTDANVLESLKQLDEMQAAAPSAEPIVAAVVDKPTKGGKKRKAWPWILLVVLLLLLGGGAYYYFWVYKPAQEQKNDTGKFDIEEMISGSEGTETANTTVAAEQENTTAGETESTSTTASKSSATAKNTNLFTYSTDLIDFSNSDIAANKAIIKDFLNDYIASYLKGKGMTSAAPYMSEQIDQYIDERLGQLFDNTGYSVERILRCDDYVHDYCLPSLKKRKAAQSRVVVQTELMDVDFLDQMLDEIMRAEGLEEVPVAPAAPVTRTAAPAAKKLAEPVHAATQSNSKQGFDVIAGFYTQRASADKMANMLKSKGCDAYIIDKNGLYYVSMGSAASRTQAEALYNHIKEWYSGDAAIKQW